MMSAALSTGRAAAGVARRPAAQPASQRTCRRTGAGAPFVLRAGGESKDFWKTSSAQPEGDASGDDGDFLDGEKVRQS